MLEKSRVVKVSNAERSYHVFYELITGSSPDEKLNYKLLSISSYNYLKDACFEVKGINDSTGFANLKLAMNILNFNNIHMDAIFKAISAILSIGNVTFSGEAAAPTDKSIVQTIAILLDIDVNLVNTVLCGKTLVVRTDSTYVPFSESQALDNRDVLAKTLYSSIFQHVVSHINKSLSTSKNSKNFIGILDIFGFESFAVNSFEQLCINYTNEKLQQFFTQDIFKMDQEQYEKENINWESITFTDNQKLIDLIESRVSLFSLLDDETKFPRATDATWLTKMITNLTTHPGFSTPKLSNDTFSISHYAGDVIYSITGFLDKNRDAISDDIINLIKSSKNKFLNQLVLEKNKATSASYFKAQLNNLVTVLGATQSHYVRCIKSNMEQTPFHFDVANVAVQLSYSGMLDTIRIRKSGYAKRVPFKEFILKYSYLFSVIIS